MQIIRVETVYVPLEANAPYAESRQTRPFIFVQIYTDEGLIGLGQTPDLRTTSSVHELAQRFLIGKDPLKIESIWREMYEYAAYHGYAGAEIRAISSIDIALWDILGQSCELPIYSLLGGETEARMPIYNTCSAFGEFDDHKLAFDDPERLVGELLDLGIRCLKVYPFDAYADKTRGQYIDRRDLRDGLAVIDALSSAGNGCMEIMVEGHARWSLTAAIEIAQGLDAYPVHWIEDMIWAEDSLAWKELRRSSPIRVAGGERILSRYQMRDLLASQGLDIMITDVTWCGGISEMRRLADMASLYGVPVAGHDHSGPVNLWASAHVLLNATNAYITETTRVFYDGYYQQLVAGDSIVDGGFLSLPKGPGLGIALRPEVRRQPDVVIERTESID